CPHERSPRCWEIDVIETDRDNHPANVAGGSDRDDKDSQDCRLAPCRKLFRLHAAVPFATSYHQRHWLARRRHISKPWRSESRAQRRAVSRRIARVQKIGIGSDAPATRRWKSNDFAGGRQSDVSS